VGFSQAKNVEIYQLLLKGKGSCPRLSQAVAVSNKFSKLNVLHYVAEIKRGKI
jgi:hypothetical protein